MNNLARLERFAKAWKTLCPDKVFAGMKLTQFLTEKLQPCYDTRQTIVDLENQMAAALNHRENADLAASEAMSYVVNAVKGDPTEGENSDLYEAMGYVRKIDRKRKAPRQKLSTPIAVPPRSPAT